MELVQDPDMVAVSLRLLVVVAVQEALGVLSEEVQLGDMVAFD